MSGITSGSLEVMESGGNALKLQADTPHLVSMGGDRLSTSVTLHPIPPGRITLGSRPGVDITIQGTGVLPLHCHIENSEGVVTLYPLSENISIDGVKICGPTRLSQGVMLTIGRSNYLRFNHPSEARLMKSVLPNPRISMAPIDFEPDNSMPTKYNRKPPMVPRRSSKESDENGEDHPPSNIMTKVSKFEYLAAQNFKKSISPKVFSSNLVTVNTPAKDVLGKAPPDLQNYTKNIPQSALNYSELNRNDKDIKPAFGKKLPQYVNVTLNETKTINNRVIIYENGCIPKNSNCNQNELNKSTKNVNVNKNQIINHTDDNYSNQESLQQRKTEAELLRSQAQQERIKEQQIGKAEQARLEEILNMCAEYEKQVQNERTKITPNRIKTNGSLPRDKRQYSPSSPSYTTNSSSDSFDQHHSSESNISYLSPKDSLNYENISLASSDSRITDCNSPYENIALAHLPHSPRTRIKTFLYANKENTPKEMTDLIENKFSLLENEQNLLENVAKTKTSSLQRKSSPNKFILPLEEIENFHATEKILNSSEDKSLENLTELQNEGESRVDSLRKEKKEILLLIARIKRQMAELKIQEEELHRGLELEKALLSGEHKSKLLDLDRIENKRQKLLKRAQKIEENMKDCQIRQEQDQEECKERLKAAQDDLAAIEKKLAVTLKTSPDYESMFEIYLGMQEHLDNERKNFEDLEFHHLEQEADWLASREEIQREIVELNNKIEMTKEQIQNLEIQKIDLSNNDMKEFKMIEKQRIKYLVRLEEVKNRLRKIDNELSLNASRESDQEISSDSESDKSYILDNRQSNTSINFIQDLSSSMILTSTKITQEDKYNMSQSFNEKLLQEKLVLEDGISKKYPSQDDIDRISKVTSNAPIDINESKGSLGRKTIESLKDIERNRHLHLCQQGSQVIEQERQRVLALKQRVQEEVRTKWAQRSLNCSSLTSSGSEEAHNSAFTSGEFEDPRPENEMKIDDVRESQSPVRSTSQEPKPIRPMSEVSEISMDSVHTLDRKRIKPASDKQRPLTRYLPIRRSDLDLRQHIESAGHQVVLCPHVIINSSTCRGFLHKKGSKLNGWSKRWFVFDRNKHTFTYYADKSEKKPRGGAYFQAIEEVYLDHLNSIKSPNPHLTFIVKTHERYYHLMAPSPEAMRIWVDVIFTGAEGYQEFEHGT